MHTTPDKPPIGERTTAVLIDELWIALRDVGVWDHDLPAGNRVVTHIESVQALHRELVERRVDLSDHIAMLSKQTSWQMSVLLADCLSYPDTIPYVRELDGIRRRLRCWLCATRERPADAKLFWFCNSCMDRVLHAVRSRQPVKGIVLFRTYNPEHRCAHANEDTVLAAYEGLEDLTGACDRCLVEEIERRAAI